MAGDCDGIQASCQDVRDRQIIYAPYRRYRERKSTRRAVGENGARLRSGGVLEAGGNTGGPRAAHITNLDKATTPHQLRHPQLLFLFSYDVYVTSNRVYDSYRIACCLSPCVSAEVFVDVRWERRCYGQRSLTTYPFLLPNSHLLVYLFLAICIRRSLSLLRLASGLLFIWIAQYRYNI